jgi:hypothetical protein
VFRPGLELLTRSVVISQPDAYDVYARH